MDLLRNHRRSNEVSPAQTRPPPQRRPSGPRFSTELLKRSATFFLLAAVVFRVAQYLANRSLWLNEADVALNVLNRGFASLVSELDFNQGAPVGFLWIEKVVTSVIGSSEFAFRLFPLVCGLASIYLFFRLAREVVAAHALPIALLLFATSNGLIYYASEVKQYSTDVAATLFLTLLAYSILDTRISYRRSAATAVAGVLVVGFSHAAAFVLLAIVVVFSVELVRLRRSSASKPLLLIVATWAVGGLTVAALSLDQLTQLRSSLPARTEPLSIGYALHWFNKFGTALGESLGLLLGPGWASSLLLKIAAVVSVVGIVSLFRRHRAKCLILILPAVFVYIAYLANLYPLFPRTVLFVVPAGIIVLAQGVTAVVTPLPRIAAISIGATLATALCVVPVSYAAYHLVVPRQHEEIRPVLQDIRRSWRPGDAIYLHYGAQYAFLYYLQCRCFDLTPGRGRVPLWRPRRSRFAPDEFAPALVSRPPRFFVGRYAGYDFKSYLRDLQRLQGLRRVWILYTHLSGAGELEFVTGPWLMRLDEMGRRLAEFHAPQAHAFLYDFGANRPVKSRAGSDTRPRGFHTSPQRTTP
jgi:hypothetical protein